MSVRFQPFYHFHTLLLFLQVHRQTALHIAIEHRQTEVIAALIGASSSARWISADLNLKDSLDRTPLSLALSKGMHDVAVALLRGGASVNVINSTGLTLLHLAIKDGDSEGANFLLNNGADIDMR